MCVLGVAQLLHFGATYHRLERDGKISRLTPASCGQGWECLRGAFRETRTRGGKWKKTGNNIAPGNIYLILVTLQNIRSVTWRHSCVSEEQRITCTVSTPTKVEKKHPAN